MKQNKKSHLRTILKSLKITGGILAATLVGAIALEPVISAAQESVNVNLTVNSYTTFGCGAGDTDLSPSVYAYANPNGVATGSRTCNMETNDPDGYTVNIKNAQTANAMKHTVETDKVFADYSDGGSAENWVLTDNTTSEFGFGASGTDAETQFSACGDGAGSCYLGLETTDTLIASSTEATPGTTGTDTTVSFKAEVGTNKNQPAGSYQAQITITGAAQ
jgi:hypothetical protein